MSFRTASTRPGGILGTAIKLALLAALAIALMAIIIVGFLVVLPLMLIVGIASYFHFRRRVRQARRHATSDVIDAEYTVIDRR